MIYVKGDATGAGDGSSWSNAFLSLQPAIDIASVSDQVWIAQGTYRPTSWPNGGTTEREKHFSLKNGVSVYGGFAGIETALTQRDSTIYPTTLSGDLDGNDADGDGDGRSDPATISNNCYHVLYWSNSTILLSRSAVLDGVMIRGGNADGLTPHNRGGGICNIYAEPSISNCTVADNSSSQGGGGIYNFHSSPLIACCSISDNAGGVYGGGIYNDTVCSTTTADCTVSKNRARFGAGVCNVMYASPSMARCTIASNSASSDGGGVYNDDMCSMIMANCTVAHNSSRRGAGIFSRYASPSMTNCTIAGNSAIDDGGGVYFNLVSYYYQPPSIANCILWTNSPAAQIYGVGESFPVASSVVQGGYPGGSNIISADPLILPLGDHGGLTATMPVSLGSPAIDAGIVDASIPTHDQRCFLRDALPDIGACEFQALALVSDVSNPAAIGSQFTLRAISDIAGATFQWFGRQSGNTWDPMEGGTNGLFATPRLELGLDLFVRMIDGGTNIDSVVQQIEVRGTYPEWVAFHGLAGADAETGASPAADGIPNLVKYASGLDPHTSAVPSDHSTLFSVPASNTVSLIWIQSKTPTDLTWGFRQSHDLRAWSPADAVPNLCESNSACNVWSITLPVETNSLFLDVEVTRSAP